MNSSFTRRTFIKNTSVALASLPLINFKSLYPDQEFFSEGIPLKWLDGKSPELQNGVTWGVPWPRSSMKKLASFKLKGETGESDVESWPLAYWPDGSLKWTAHALPHSSNLGEKLKLIATHKTTSSGIETSETPDQIKINTGKIEVLFNKRGNTIIPQITRAKKQVATNGRLIVSAQDKAEYEPGIPVTNKEYTGEIKTVLLERKGKFRTLVKVEGIHSDTDGKTLLPFILRFYLYANSDNIRILHTIIYDADENQNFISGIGFKMNLSFQNEELHNRHVRFSGQGSGVFSEAVRGLTGLRRDPGLEVRKAQTEGRKTPEVSTFPQTVSKRMDYIAAFGDYTLYQGSPDAFDIQKRTRSGYGWVQSAYGKRSSGTAYLGTPSSGIAFGIRNFWQSYPAQLDIRNAHLDQGEIALWLWAPKSPAMDLRFYHDGMGQDTYQKQLEGLEINYEDYEPGFGTPEGVARTSEMFLQVLDKTPTNTVFSQIAESFSNPPVIVPEASYLHKAGAFGRAFSLPDTQNTGRKEIEEQLNFYFDYYKAQVDQHSWYGFWNYGDVMHSYDQDRNMWKYDIGGYAWDNSELSTDIWLWTYFLATGRADAFRMAEAMTRHTGEVDVHHTGKFSPLGSRHNVYHWGCSAKQMRISTAANRRYYYYLTGDERVGDLMHEQINAVKTLQRIVPVRKVNPDVPKNTEDSDVATVSFGTDWGAVASAWLTEWERTRSSEMKNKLLNSMRTIAAQPKGFFTGYSLMNLHTGEYEIDKTNRISVSHLSAVFGLPELCFELIEMVNDPAFEKAWIQYCTLYNASAEEQKAGLGESLKKLNLQQGHARLTAYAAYKTGNPKLGERAWQEFRKGEGGIRNTSRVLTAVKGPEVLNPLTVAEDVSTNAVAQWGLSAMQCLAFAPESLK